MNGNPTKKLVRSPQVPNGAKQGVSQRPARKAANRKVPRLQAGHPRNGNGSAVPEMRRGSGSAGLLQVRGPARSHHHRGSIEDADSGQPELILRPGYVRIESLPDDFRNAPLDFNLKQTLVIPDCAKEPSRLARVMALGADGYEYSVAPGDIVLCNRYPQSFQGFDWREGKVGFMRETEILAKVVTDAL